MYAPKLRQRARRPQPAPDASAACLLAIVAVDAARLELDHYAMATDAPAWQVVEAADLLDAAHAKLAEAIKGATT